MGGSAIDFDDFGIGRGAQADASDAESALALPNDSDKVDVTSSRGKGAAPLWITNLHDPVLRADFKTFYHAGSITEAEMANALKGLAAELTNSHSALSSKQLSDLHSIANHIGSMGASPYLEFITNAFVKGDSDNATWTGGGSSSSTLGNLGVGESVKHFNELIGKWFLGTDLPDDTINMTGDDEFVISYSTVNKPLFGPSGPSMSDINQGQLGDCFFLAPLAEAAEQDPSLIESMIVGNGNGTYGVRFYVDGAARYVTVDNKLANGGSIFNSSNNIWSSLAEEAYAKLQGAGNVTDNGDDAANSFSIIGNGGQPEYALEEITGASAITDFAASGSSWDENIYNPSQTMTSSAGGSSNATVLSIIEADLAAGNDVLLGSDTNAFDSNGNQTLVSDHELSIYGYDSNTDMLEVRNPWGTAPGQSWDTTFEVGLGALLADDDVITTDDIAKQIDAANVSLFAASALHKT